METGAIVLLCVLGGLLLLAVGGGILGAWVQANGIFQEQQAQKRTQEARERELNTVEHWEKKLIVGRLATAEAEQNLERLSRQTDLPPGRVPLRGPVDGAAQTV